MNIYMFIYTFIYIYVILYIIIRYVGMYCFEDKRILCELCAK